MTCLMWGATRLLSTWTLVAVSVRCVNLRFWMRAGGGFMRWLWAAALALGGSAAQAAGYGAPPADLGARLDRLVKAYPDFISSHDEHVLVLKDGRKFAISDGRTDKTFDEMVEHADI